MIRPTRVDQSDVRAFLALLGAPVELTSSVEILSDKIVVTVARLDETGNVYAVGNEIATETWDVAWRS